VTGGVLLLTLLSLAPVGNLALYPLEQKYRSVPSEERESPEFIVVLAGGQLDQPISSVVSQISSESLKRLVEGVALLRSYPGSKLVLSGGSQPYGGPSIAEIMARIAEHLGVSPADLILEAKSRDTAEQASRIGSIVGTNSFSLVTSANHMPRSVGFFEGKGMRPKPIPTAFLIEKSSVTDLRLFVPSARSLLKLDASCHEYIGTIWSKLTGIL